MSLPDIPSPFRPPTPPERPWWWALADASGAPVDVAAAGEELADQRFASQGDAESWVGEVWRELAEAGVVAVVLHEHDRVVYGPMSLSE
jgi:hypothetical protein